MVGVAGSGGVGDGGHYWWDMCCSCLVINKKIMSLIKR